MSQDLLEVVSVQGSMNMNEHDKVLLNAIWHMIGIVPIENSHTGVDNDINRALSSLPSPEAREMKRKFRKLWRKVAKKRLDKPKVNKASIMKLFGFFPLREDSDRCPSRSQKVNRKRAVLNHVYEEILIPMKKSAGRKESPK